MEHPPELPGDMAAVVASNPQHPQQQPQSGPKRYRPAPAKTFQCRGYGECRMVFSRSEHLARHIRKHTGERPFTCHCGKQFSRLDNLRQHAQTVHADKQEQNERMMRDLTSLHASMAAANKLASARGGRRPPPPQPVGASNGTPTACLVKQEDLPMPLHQRPGTSTGYEGDHDGFLYHQQPSWHVQTADSKPNNNSHSFRDSNQSFLAPPATSPSPAAAAAPGQSFLPFSSIGFGVPDPASVRDGRPRTSSSRPTTSSKLADPNSRSLPPLSAVVSASLSASPGQQHIQPFPAPPGSSHGQSGSGSSVLLPNTLTLRRPTTATRPGTAPASASLFSAKPAFAGGAGLGFSRPELSIQSYGRPANPHLGFSNYDACPPSPPGNDASPFFFSPPSLDTPTTTAPASSSSPASVNPRKRPFAGPDGPYDDSTSPRDPAHDYDYDTESRPQSRRLSVMELCNDANNSAGPSTFLLSSTRAESRPTTSGLVSSASALALADRPSPTLPSPSSIQPRSTQYSTTASRGNGGGGGSGQEEFGGDRVSSTLRRTIPSPSSILPFRSGAGSIGPTFAHSPTFSAASTASFSPRSPSGSTSPFSPRSPLSGADATPGSIPRRTHGDDGQHDQIRFARASHASPALGLRV